MAIFIRYSILFLTVIAHIGCIDADDTDGEPRSADPLGGASNGDTVQPADGQADVNQGQTDLAPEPEAQVVIQDPNIYTITADTTTGITATDPGAAIVLDTTILAERIDIQAGENYFTNQTGVVIADLESPCPSQDPDRCFESNRANPEYDQSNNGIYKGVITGEHSGNILLTIRNDFEDQLEADFTYHTDSFQVSISEFKRSNGTYEYRFNNSDYDFGLVIAEDGEVVRDSALLYVPGGQTAVVTIAKELSTHLVEVFEGTFDGIYYGIWNYINIANLTSEGNYRESSGMEGIVVGKAISPVTFVGHWQSKDLGAYWGNDFGFRDGDEVWGTWYWQNVDSGVSGQWEGAKTL